MAVFGEKIAQLRKARSITQEEFAAKIGVTAQAVSKWENGANMPDVMLLPVIADVFDVTIDELLTDRRSGAAHMDFNSAPRAAYQAALKTSVAACETYGREHGREIDIMKLLREDRDAQHGVLADDGT